MFISAPYLTCSTLACLAAAECTAGCRASSYCINLHILYWGDSSLTEGLREAQWYAEAVSTMLGARAKPQCNFKPIQISCLFSLTPSPLQFLLFIPSLLPSQRGIISPYSPPTVIKISCGAVALSACYFFISLLPNPSSPVFVSLILWSSTFICPSGQLVKLQLLKPALHEKSLSAAALVVNSTAVSFLTIKVPVGMFLLTSSQLGESEDAEAVAQQSACSSSFSYNCMWSFFCRFPIKKAIISWITIYKPQHFP